MGQLYPVGGADAHLFLLPLSPVTVTSTVYLQPVTITDDVARHCLRPCFRYSYRYSYRHHSPLLFAMTVQALLELGARPNCADSKGTRPIDQLQRPKPSDTDTELVKLLVEHGGRSTTEPSPDGAMGPLALQVMLSVMMTVMVTVTVTVTVMLRLTGTLDRMATG